MTDNYPLQELRRGTSGPVEVKEPVSSLLDFWNATRLRASSARSTSALRSSDGTTMSWRDALRDILRVGYGLESQCRYASGEWRCRQNRTTPSAGALYPFEVIASVVTALPDAGNYFYDVRQGILIPHRSAAFSRGELKEMSFRTSSGLREEALIILVARPWLTMKKYRLRGYAYCHLDVGHAATSLALYAYALGYAPTLHLRFSSAAVSRRLNLDGLCREPLVALSFSRADSGDRDVRPSANGCHYEAAGPVTPELPGREEMENWESLREILSLRSRPEAALAPAYRNPLLDEKALPADALRLPEPRFASATLEELKAAILKRRSAKGFKDEPLDIEQISDLLSSLRNDGLRSDCSAGDPLGLRLRLVARNIAGLRGIYSYDTKAHRLHRIGAPAKGYDFRSACMQQELAGSASALLLFHAPIRRLIDDIGYSAFAELHFHAARLAHQLYLTAVRANVGLTCVGGFDETQCADLGRLDSEDEVIYVVVLGVADDAATKFDRSAIAYSHGHTT